ncbi:MAG: hypothetical protein U0807_07980 [Candidatus Binatia bacterium]
MRSHRRSNLSLQAVLAVFLLAAPVATRAASVVVVTSEPGDPVGQGVPRRFDVNVQVGGQLEPNEVRVEFFEPTSFFTPDWSFVFRAPHGARIVPGVYEGATRGAAHLPNEPLLSVFTLNHPCDTVTGRFEVFAATYDVAGNVTSFSADFEEHCNGSAAALRGAIRFAIGDAACAGMPDRTPCDDGDACTESSHCVAGRCAGVVSVGCPSSGPCRRPVCHPSTGACVGEERARNFTTCEDDDLCTGTGSCRDGECVTYSVTDCRDGDDCTDDVCRPDTGCLHPPIAGRCGVPGTPSSFVFLRRSADRYRSATVYRQSAADGTMSAFVSGDDGVWLDFVGPSALMVVQLIPPGGGRLAPGTYEHVASRSAQRPGQAALDVGSDGLACVDAEGRFVVHEVVYGPGETVRALSADFEQHCPDGSAALSGAVRLHAGDAAGAVDGTPCDMDDACLEGAACRAGQCVGAGLRACAAPDACHAETFCDPTSGTCADAPTLYDGAPCDDGSVCTTRDLCQAGRCVGTGEIACDDGNVCTHDRCDPALGCVVEPIAGTCWLLSGRSTFTASALGHSCTCTQRAGFESLALFDDGRYAVEGGTCPNGDDDLPDEHGTWRPRGRRLVLQSGNLADVTDAVTRCTGTELRIRGYRTVVRLASDGTRLRGIHTDSSGAVGSPVTMQTVTRFVGRLGDGRVPPETRRRRNACIAALTSCLRDAIR